MTREQRTILAVATATQAFAIGTTIGVFPLVLEPLEVDFGVPRTRIAIGPVLIMVALSSAGVPAGTMLDGGRVRRAMLFGALLLATAFGIAAVAPALWMLAFAALAAGFSVPFIGPLAGMTLVSRLFPDSQGRAYGIMSTGPGIGSGLFSGLAGILVAQSGWRMVYAVLAGAVVFVLVPIIWRFVPVRVDAPAAVGGKASPVASLGSVLRRPLFWWSAAVFALAAGIGSGWTNHFAAFLGGVGFDEAEVAGLVAVQFWMGVLGALGFGILSDRAPLFPLFATLLGVQSLGFAVYATTTSTLWIAVVGLAFGFVAGGLVPLYMALLGSRLEPSILGRAMGLTNILMLPLTATATLFAAASFESHGDYRIATQVFAAGFAWAIVCLALSFRSSARERIAGEHDAAAGSVSGEVPTV